MYTTIMELGPQDHNGNGLLGPNSIRVLYIDPLGKKAKRLQDCGTLNPKP